METCPECGRPLERADDFWYCDNPDCLHRNTRRRPLEKEAAAGIATGTEAEQPGRQDRR